MITNPESCVFPIEGSGAADDLRQALADKDDYHVPKIQWIRCKRKWCSTDRIAMWMIVVARNGHRVAQLRCIACCALDQTRTAESVGVQWPVIRDYAAAMPECERCGDASGIEVHHWAPRHLFRDADLWPTANLCRDCHQLWHRVVTPNMAQQRGAA
jgi:hypothetical protein